MGGVRDWMAFAIALALLVGCDEKPQSSATPPRPVRTATLDLKDVSETLSAVGEIHARYEVDLGFRIAGKLLQRPVEVGMPVAPGTLLAQLDDQPKQSELRSARAALAAAEAELTRTTAEEARQSQLIQQGFATRQHYETAVRDRQTAQSQVSGAREQLKLAEDAVGYSALRADGNGIVSAVYAEPGEVVAAGQHIVRVAQTDEREASFSVPETVLSRVPRDVEVEVGLVSDPKIKARGSVRYISPEADPATRTFLVRVSLPDAPRQMRLGSTVEGRVKLPAQYGFEIPGSALFEKDGKPAVWRFDPATQTVAPAPVTVQRYDGDTAIVGGSIKGGEIVVTAGVHLLHPGQRVRRLAAAP